MRWTICTLTSTLHARTSGRQFGRLETPPTPAVSPAAYGRVKSAVKGMISRRAWRTALRRLAQCRSPSLAIPAVHEEVRTGNEPPHPRYLPPRSSAHLPLLLGSLLASLRKSEARAVVLAVRRPRAFRAVVRRADHRVVIAVRGTNLLEGRAKLIGDEPAGRGARRTIAVRGARLEQSGVDACGCTDRAGSAQPSVTSSRSRRRPGMNNSPL